MDTRAVATSAAGKTAFKMQKYGNMHGGCHSLLLYGAWHGSENPKQSPPLAVGV